MGGEKRLRAVASSKTDHHGVNKLMALFNPSMLLQIRVKLRKVTRTKLE